MGKIVTAVLVVVVLLSGAYLYRPVYIEPAPVSAQDDVRVTVNVIRHADDNESGECQLALWDTLSETTDIPQVIITNAAGEIVGYVDYWRGEAAEVEMESVCGMSEAVALRASPFYTFTVDGVYQRTVSDDVLNGTGGEISIRVG